MPIRLLLIGYLLLAVIQPGLYAISSGQVMIFLFACVNLLLFVVGIIVLRDHFLANAQHYQERIVFSSGVVCCFSLASSVLVGSLLTGLMITGLYVSSVMIGRVLIFRILAWLFDIFVYKHKKRFLRALISLFVLIGGLIVRVLDVDNYRIRNAGIERLGVIQMPRRGGTEVTVETGVMLDDIKSSSIEQGSGDVDAKEQPGSGNVVTGDLDDQFFVLGSGPITYSVLLPVLDTLYRLPPTSASPTFVFIDREDDLYPVFQRAWALKMIGTNTNPDRQVRCANLMVMIGLIEQWQINTTLPVMDAYRRFAGEEKRLGACVEKDRIVTVDMLRSILSDYSK